MTAIEEGALIERHQGLVWSRVHRCVRRDRGRLLSPDELFTTGMEGLLHAVRNYRDRGGRLSTYAVTCIDGYLLSALDELHPLGRNAARYRVRLTRRPVREADRVERPAFGQRAEVQELLAFLRPRERVVLRLRYLEGLDAKVVALRMGLCVNRVRQIQDEALSRLRRRTGTVVAA